MDTLTLHPVRHTSINPTQVVAEDGSTDVTVIDNDVSSEAPFIVANTISSNLDEIKTSHVIPVFVKDNEPAISQAEFIELTSCIISDVFHGEKILKPVVRLSHAIKGRIPEAKDKPANQLLEREKTIYYERMAFVVEVPSISEILDGNNLSLMIGGIKAYNLDNLYHKKGADEHFKAFIGFQNKVCTNLCIWTDGLYRDLKVSSVGQLSACIRSLLQNYNHQHHLFHLKQLCPYSLSEHQFAQLIGRCRMYQHLPVAMQNEIPKLPFGDQQIGTVVRDFYKDRSFSRSDDGTINLWRLYNLFTSANKSTYIDQFAERSVVAFDFAFSLKQALQNQTFTWYLS